MQYYISVEFHVLHLIIDVDICYYRFTEEIAEFLKL